MSSRKLPPPPPRPPIDSEPPTLRDVQKFVCDECGGNGFVACHDEAGSICKRSCDVCFGKCWVDRERRDWWRQNRERGG